MAEIKTGVSSVRQIDFSHFRMPILAVYQYPDDYPDKCVMRVFDGSTPTNVYIAKDDLREIMEDIAKNTGFVFINRCPSDVASLIGTWL